MNETVAIIFIRRLAPFDSVIVYEQADIDWCRIDYEYVKVGKVIYDTEKRVIIRRY